MNVVPETTPTDDEAPGRGFWIGLVLGVPVMAYGATELIHQTGWPRARSVAVWLGSGLLLHDLIIAPALIVLVWATGKVFPPAVRTPVRAGILATALVLAIGWPALRGYGNRTDNRTVHPLNYSTAILTAVALVWLVILGWILAGAIHRRQTRPGA